MHSLKSSWRRLVITDVLFKIVAFVLLTPLVSLMFRGFLWLSGHTVLADTDIARFFLHPLGWITVVVVGGATIAVLALEQAALMVASLSADHAQPMSVPNCLLFVVSRAAGIFRITAEMVVRLLLIATPFTAVAGILYVMLLTDHDINFYLTEKPPVFLFAVSLGGIILTVLAAIVIHRIVGWSVAIQLHLFEEIAPRECLKVSRDRVAGSRMAITNWVVIWLVVNLLISFSLSAVVIELGTWMVPRAAGSIWTLVIALGAVLLMWGIVNFGTSLLAVISLALIQEQVYERFGRSSSFHLPEAEGNRPSWTLSWTRGRVIAALTIALLTSTLIGAAAIHTVELRDDVQITAHRGASGNAPENTLASVRRAIEDGTDWVEIDVQESKDGVVIVAHDSDLKKVAGKPVKIWEATADELRAIDIGSYFATEFKNERIPTLAEVLEVCRGKANLNIELKYYGHDQNLEQKVVDLVEHARMVNNVVIMSLQLDGIRKIQKLRPDWTVGLLSAVAAGDLTRVDVDFLAVNAKLATRPFIESAHNKEKEVYVWTINDPFTMSSMISRGVDNLITDHPDLARRVLAERAEMSPVERLLLELAILLGAETSVTAQ